MRDEHGKHIGRMVWSVPKKGEKKDTEMNATFTATICQALAQMQQLWPETVAIVYVDCPNIHRAGDKEACNKRAKALTKVQLKATAQF